MWVAVARAAHTYKGPKKKKDGSRDGQNHHMLMIIKSKSNHLNKGDLKSKLFWKS